MARGSQVGPWLKEQDLRRAHNGNRNPWGAKLLLSIFPPACLEGKGEEREMNDIILGPETNVCNSFDFGISVIRCRMYRVDGTSSKDPGIY